MTESEGASLYLEWVVDSLSCGIRQGKAMGSPSWCSVGNGVDRANSGEGRGARMRLGTRVGPYPRADPEGPTGTGEDPTGGNPVGAPLGSLGAKAHQRGVACPNRRDLAS